MECGGVNFLNLREIHLESNILVFAINTWFQEYALH